MMETDPPEYILNWNVFPPNRILRFWKRFALRLKSVVMEKDACVEQKIGDNPAMDQVKQQPASTAPYRYSKVRKTTVELIVQ